MSAVGSVAPEGDAVDGVATEAVDPEGVDAGAPEAARVLPAAVDVDGRGGSGGSRSKDRYSFGALFLARDFAGALTAALRSAARRLMRALSFAWLFLRRIFKERRLSRFPMRRK